MEATYYDRITPARFPTTTDKKEESSPFEDLKLFAADLVKLIVRQNEASAKNNIHEQVQIRKERADIKGQVEKLYENTKSLQADLTALGLAEKLPESGEELYYSLVDFSQGVFYQQSIEDYLCQAGIAFEMSEDRVCIFALEYVTQAKILNGLDIETFIHQDEASVIISKKDFPSLALYLKKERDLLNALQKQFDALFEDNVEKDWGISILIDGIGGYRIDIRSQQNLLKKIFSIHQLLGKARINLTSEGKPAVLDHDYIKRIETHFTFNGHKALESILKIFRTAQVYQEQLKRVFFELDPKIKIGLGKKPLTDLYQHSSTAPGRFREIHGISYELAQDLQKEQGDVVLANSFNVSTYDDGMMHLLERYFYELRLAASNGQPKTFLIDTRASGKCHKANIGWYQMEDLKRLFNQLFFMMQVSSSRDVLKQNERTLINNYGEKVAKNLKDFVKQHLHVTPLHFSSELDSKFVSLKNADSFEKIEATKAEIYQRLLDAFTVPGNRVWKEPDQVDIKDIRIKMGTAKFDDKTDKSLLERFEVIAKEFENSAFFQKSKANFDIVPSWKSLEQVFKNRIKSSPEYKKVYYNGPGMTIQALDFFERVVYNLIYGDLSEQSCESLRLYFIAQKQDWVGCSEGLASKMQKMLELTIGDESIDAEILKIKKTLLDIYWEMRGAQGMCPAGYSFESATFESAVKKELTKQIGLGIGYNQGVNGSRGYDDYVEQAESLIKRNVRPYDHIFDLFFKSFAKTFSTVQENVESPEMLLRALGINDDHLIQTNADTDTPEWRTYFNIEQKLPELVFEFLRKQGYLNIAMREEYGNARVYKKFLDELAEKNPTVYRRRIGEPPRRTYQSSVGSTATSQMSGYTYKSHSSGSE